MTQKSDAQSEPPSRSTVLSDRARESWARLQERAAATGARLRDRLEPVLEEQLTDWPTELDRQLSLSGETAQADAEVPEGTLVVYVHGFLGQGRLEIAKMSGAHQAAALQHALDAEFEAHERDGPAVVAGMWDSSTTWPRAKKRAPRAGDRLAEWLRTRPAASVHLIGHSLGARVALEALDSDPGDAVASVALLGAAVDPDAVCHEYYPAIESVDGNVYNYHSENDTIVCRLYRVGELSAGLGCRGSDCRGGLLRSAGRVPENFTDVDVSAQVTGHLDYYKPAEHTASGNCVGEIVDNQL